MHRNLQSWLRQRIRQETLVCILVGIVSALASLIALAVTLYFTFFVLLLCGIRVFAVFELLGWRLPSPYLRGPWLFFASFLFLVLLFIGNATTSREYLGSIPRVTWTSNPLSPSVFQAVARLITSLLFSGPQLTVAALNLFRKAVRLIKFDIPIGAEILTLLASKDSRVSFREIGNQIAHINPVKIFPQFRDVDGVVFLINAPDGLSLTDELRTELRAVLGCIESVGEKQHDTSSQPDTGTASTFYTEEQHCYQILGIKPSASTEEAKAAYRRLMKEHHPDRVAGLGEALHALAEERTKEINQAYEDICARLTGGKTATGKTVTRQ